MARIALVDDDDLFRESVEQNLKDAEFEVFSFERGQTVLDFLLSGEKVDLILLDWKMPGLSGIEVLRRLRDQGVGTPTIFLTLLSDQVYEEAALATGAVDFVEKSRSFHILRRRIELILDGAKGSGEPDAGSAVSSEAVRIGELELHPGSGRASWRAAEVPLTFNEFGMVHLLATRAGQDLRYRDLYDHVRGSGFAAGVGPEGYKTNVRTFIKRIRQKFREIDPEFDQIENYPGFGYRWRHD
ncbi:MAG: response regulator transcription factor [Alphaproteobacteria bacterium]